jgi:hypothetical protein
MKCLVERINATYETELRSFLTGGKRGQPSSGAISSALLISVRKWLDHAASPRVGVLEQTLGETQIVQHCSRLLTDLFALVGSE